MNDVGITETIIFAIVLFIKTEYELKKKFGDVL